MVVLFYQDIIKINPSPSYFGINKHDDCSGGSLIYSLLNPRRDLSQRLTTYHTPPPPGHRVGARNRLSAFS